MDASIEVSDSCVVQDGGCRRRGDFHDDWLQRVSVGGDDVCVGVNNDGW